MLDQIFAHRRQIHIFTLCAIGAVVKNLPADAGDTRDVGLIPGSGRAPGGGNGNPLQYSCLKIPWIEEPGRLHTVHGVTKSLT